MDNLDLIRLPDLHEIKQALFSIDSIKTPGPNGFGAGFFKQYWNIVGHDFSNSIVDFFRNGNILKEISHTFITLIPEIDNPSQMNHDHPISICSTIYKTISKILVNRMRPLLGKTQALKFINPKRNACCRVVECHPQRVAFQVSAFNSSGSI